MVFLEFPCSLRVADLEFPEFPWNFRKMSSELESRHFGLRPSLRSAPLLPPQPAFSRPRSVIQGAAAVVSPTVADSSVIYKNGVLSWDFLQTVIDIAPCSLVGAGGGMFGIAAGGGGAAFTNNGNGGLWVYRRHPVALPANTTFNILLRFGANAQALAGVTDVKIVLVGAYRQAIEIA